MARELDQILADGVQDLQLRLDVSEGTSSARRRRSELELVELATKRREWIVSPSIEAHGGRLLVRLEAATPDSNVVFVLTEQLKREQLAVRAVVMLRDLLVRRPTAAPAASTAEPVDPKRALATPSRSAGRATLSVNAALFGAGIGYSIQKASDNADPRILYPLMALGTGFGLGVAALVAEEWDVGSGDAWYISAGAWWPAAAGLFLGHAHEGWAGPEQYAGALIGAGTGLGLTVTSFALGGHMSEGGALVTHSGGAFGTVLGALAEFAIRGSTRDYPAHGLGVGAAAGVVGGGALAWVIGASSSQVMMVDLGAGLGGLAGAAATSPFLFNSTEPTKERVFVIGTMAATLAGGVVGYYAARRAGSSRAALPILPYAGVVGASVARDGSPTPAIGAGVQGGF